MTVYSRIKKTLNSLESARTDLDGYAQETDNEEAKRLYQQMSQNLKLQSQQLNQRLKKIEAEEPQFTDDTEKQRRRDE